MHGIEPEENRIVVFDVSLLAPHSQEVVEMLLEESNLTFIMTPRMQEVLRKIEEYTGILRLWDIDTRYARLIADFIRRIELTERVKVMACEELPEYRVWGYFKEAVLEKEIAQGVLADFLADEMCLALAGYPILCCASSRWRIVEFFEKIGISIIKIIRARMMEKADLLKTKRASLAILAKGIGIALVYVIKTPLDAIVQFGVEMVKLIVVDG
ncbi:MAG: hypothetical protein ACPLKQ_08705 [Candidatus Bathyarchaeales archaeon]